MPRNYPLLNHDSNRLAAPSRLIPRLEECLTDCGHLFRTFKENLRGRGCAGIVAISFSRSPRIPETTVRTIALLVRMIGKKLAGKIEGGYQAGDAEFFLLLVPAETYSEELFRQDIATIKRELERHFAFSGSIATHRRFAMASTASLMTIDGVFLFDRHGNTPDNALFRAFQELFSVFNPNVLEKPDQLAALEQIITAGLITPVFQPIFSLKDGSVHGYEALSRLTEESLFTSTEDLFDAATTHSLTAPLERLCRKKALTSARELEVPGQLFLNVCPALLQANDHERGFTAALLDRLNIEQSRVTFELTERTLIEDYDLFRRAISHYREQGYTIAIDDLGSGYAGLQMLAQLEPEYVKLARFLVNDIHQSSTRQALVEALVTFCSRIGARVIAEGIERQEELDYLSSIGVSFGQGYFLSKPAALPLPPAFQLGNRSNLPTFQQTVTSR